ASASMTQLGAPRRAGGLWVPFVAAGLAVALAAGAFLAYRAWSGSAGGPGLGKVVAASPGGKPLWIGDAALGASDCHDTPDHAIDCVGVSLASLSQSDAEDDAG